MKLRLWNSHTKMVASVCHSKSFFWYQRKSFCSSGKSMISWKIQGVYKNRPKVVELIRMGHDSMRSDRLCGTETVSWNVILNLSSSFIKEWNECISRLWIFLSSIRQASFHAYVEIGLILVFISKCSWNNNLFLHWMVQLHAWTHCKTVPCLNKSSIGVSNTTSSVYFA